ncbi:MULTISPECIES: redoxin domain-containing protein [unclassified Kribbella]|uniref:redoxin domain-containing protein n=1 Tax=unclassified Kribbella TaxID=2644121 RepID=UPI003408926B
MNATGAGAPRRTPLEALGRATEWINSPPLTAAGLRGRVVLVDFWTYTCINWLRTLPYLRAWIERYGGHGLVVVGVHTPEFGFEQDLRNVRPAIDELRVDYPVVVDNDYAIWTAFENHYWPAAYVADADGTIRHHQFGEGGYEEMEAVIQRLLAETGAGGFGPDPVEAQGTGVEVQADWQNLWSPENYLGFARTENFASKDGAVLGRQHTYAAPERLQLNQWALSGDWTMTRESVVLNEPQGRLSCRFHARDLHLVLESSDPIGFQVRIDGQPPVAAHGTDVDAHGDGTLDRPRLYQLLRQPDVVADRNFEITFARPGVRAYAFTFG